MILGDKPLIFEVVLSHQHCPGFPRVLYDAFLRLGYDGDAPIYHF
jgi:hypothetical protein